MRIGTVVNGAGSTFATRDPMEKNEAVAVKSAKHIRHK